MGANAQTTVPTYVAAQVLTAEQLNESARTGVPVFASTVTRDAAFGGTGEKTLAEGQLAYVEGTGLQSYNGTSWVTWGTAPSAGGLELISATTIGSAVSTVTVSNAFSATYDAYKITITGGASSAVNPALRMQLGSTTANYAMSVIYSSYNNTPLAAGSSGQSSFLYAGSGSQTTLSMNIDLFNPFLSELTFIYGIESSNSSGGAIGGYLNDTTSYTAFTVFPSSGTITGGIIRVYGYKN